MLCLILLTRVRMACVWLNPFRSWRHSPNKKILKDSEETRSPVYVSWEPQIDELMLSHLVWRTRANRLLKSTYRYLFSFVTKYRKEKQNYYDYRSHLKLRPVKFSSGVVVSNLYLTTKVSLIILSLSLWILIFPSLPMILNLADFCLVDFIFR